MKNQAEEVDEMIEQAQKEKSQKGDAETKRFAAKNAEGQRVEGASNQCVDEIETQKKEWKRDTERS